MPFPVGTRVRLGGRNVLTLVFETGRPARIDLRCRRLRRAPAVAREAGFRSAVGAPISVEGRLWGVMMVDFRPREPAARRHRGAAGRVHRAGRAPRSRTRRRAWSCAASPRSRPRCGGWRRWSPGRRPPEEVFAAVAAEAGRLLPPTSRITEPVRPGRHGDGRRRLEQRPAVPPCRRRHPVAPRRADLHTLVFRTGRPARIDDYGEARPRPLAPLARRRASARGWACRSASRAGCGASSSVRPGASRCRRTPRRGWPGSPSWSPPRSPTPRRRPR